MTDKTPRELANEDYLNLSLWKRWRLYCGGGAALEQWLHDRAARYETQHDPDFDPIVKGMELGISMAVALARNGALRLSPLPWDEEIKHHPYTVKLQPWKITKLAWQSWYKERKRS